MITESLTAIVVLFILVLLVNFFFPLLNQPKL